MIGGDENTYCGDYTWTDGTVLFVGGAWGSGSAAGLWYLKGYESASYSNSDVGARLDF